MEKVALASLASAVVMLIMDAGWIYLNYDSYRLNTEAIQKSAMMVKWLPAAIAYFLMIVGIVLCLVHRRDALWQNAIYGGVLGLLIYGIYNATSMAILTDYNVWVAIKDTLWGTTLFSIVVTVGNVVYDKIT